MCKLKTIVKKTVIINLITVFLLCNNLYSQSVANSLYILQAPNTCTACLGLYGDYLSKIDRRFEINFVFNEKEVFTEPQLKQIVNNYYFLKRSFNVIQKDTLFNRLLKIAKIKAKNLDKVPLLFYSIGHQSFEFIDFLDKIPERLSEINSCYKKSILIKSQKFKIEENIVNSCPNCFINIINDTFIIGNNFTSNINLVSLREKSNTSRISTLNLLSDKNYISIFESINSKDTNGYREFRNLPLAPLITVKALPINNLNYTTCLYYSVIRDSISILPGPVKYGLVKSNKIDSKLIPIIYSDSIKKTIALYNFIDLKNDTLIFMLIEYDGRPKCNAPFLARFKKFNDDSIVFLDFLPDIKYKCLKNTFQSYVIPVFRNEWILLQSSNKIHNIKTKEDVNFNQADILKYFYKKERYSIVEKQINWIDMVETSDFYEIIFADKKKIFSVCLSKTDGYLLGGYSYPITERATTIIQYNNKYYYFSLDSNLSQISFN